MSDDETAAAAARFRAHLSEYVEFVKLSHARHWVHTKQFKGVSLLFSSECDMNMLDVCFHSNISLRSSSSSRSNSVCEGCDHILENKLELVGSSSSGSSSSGSSSQASCCHLVVLAVTDVALLMYRLDGTTSLRDATMESIVTTLNSFMEQTKCAPMLATSAEAILARTLLAEWNRFGHMCYWSHIPTTKKQLALFETQLRKLATTKYGALLDACVHVDMDPRLQKNKGKWEFPHLGITSHSIALQDETQQVLKQRLADLSCLLQCQGGAHGWWQRDPVLAAWEKNIWRFTHELVPASNRCSDAMLRMWCDSLLREDADTQYAWLGTQAEEFSTANQSCYKQYCEARLDIPGFFIPRFVHGVALDAKETQSKGSPSADGRSVLHDLDQPYGAFEELDPNAIPTALVELGDCVASFVTTSINLCIVSFHQTWRQNVEQCCENATFSHNSAIHTFWKSIRAQLDPLLSAPLKKQQVSELKDTQSKCVSSLKQILVQRAKLLQHTFAKSPDDAQGILTTMQRFDASVCATMQNTELKLVALVNASSYVQKQQRSVGSLCRGLHSLDRKSASVDGATKQNFKHVEDDFDRLLATVPADAMRMKRTFINNNTTKICEIYKQECLAFESIRDALALRHKWQIHPTILKRFERMQTTTARGVDIETKVLRDPSKALRLAWDMNFMWNFIMKFIQLLSGT
jgi:hypothetical protein